jgi:hypothetical protein
MEPEQELCNKMEKYWHITNIENNPKLYHSSDTTVSYDITKMNQIVTTGKYEDEPKPTDNVWIGISHVHLPTCWCPLCESWESHPESLHHDRMAFMKKIREKVQQTIYKYPSERYTREKDRRYNNNDQDNARS